MCHYVVYLYLLNRSIYISLSYSPHLCVGFLLLALHPPPSFMHCISMY